MSTIMTRETAHKKSTSRSFSGKILSLTKSIGTDGTIPKDQILDNKIKQIYSTISTVIVNHKDAFFQDVFAALPPFFLEHIYDKEQKYFIRYFIKPILNIAEGRFSIVKIKPEILKTSLREISVGYIIKRNIERAMLNINEYKVYLEKSHTLFTNFLAAFSDTHNDNIRYFEFVRRIKKLVAELIKKQQIYLEKQVRGYLESTGFQKFYYPHNNRESKSLYYKEVRKKNQEPAGPITPMDKIIPVSGNGHASRFEVVIINYEYLINEEMFNWKGEQQQEISQLIYLPKITSYSEISRLEKKLSYLQKIKYREEQKEFKLQHKKKLLSAPWLTTGLWLCGWFCIITLLSLMLNTSWRVFMQQLISQTRQGAFLPLKGISAVIRQYYFFSDRLTVFFQPPEVGAWQVFADFLAHFITAAFISLLAVLPVFLLSRGGKFLYKLLNFSLFKLRFGNIKRTLQKYEKKDINGFFNIHNAIKFITAFNRKHQDIDELIKKS